MNWLIPDNVREQGEFAPRLSPTNLGLLLNARIAAVHFGLMKLAEFDSIRATVWKPCASSKSTAVIFSIGTTWIRSSRWRRTSYPRSTAATLPLACGH